jgi:hypothetical protein
MRLERAVEPLDPRGVYRVRVPSDEEPEARLAIAPRVTAKELSFFDTLRERTLVGRFLRDKRAAADAVCFQIDGGERLFFEPMTLERYAEIKDRIDGRPEFASEAELRAFYLDMVELD